MKKIEVMLVDDEPDFLDTMGFIIKGWGYDLTTAAGGREAVAMFTEKRPDIIVLDYIMPEMDGIAVLKEIRKLDKNIPVIVLTSSPDMKTMQGTKNLGVNMIIPKLSAYSSTQASLKSAIDMMAKNISKK